MIANSRCIACNLSKKEEKIRKHSDEKKKKEFIQKVTGILYKYGDIESTPMLDKRIQDIYNEYYEEETDYIALKHKYNQYMLEREDEIKEHLKDAKDIKDYIKYVCVGNYIDFGVTGNIDDQMLDDLLKKVDSLNIPEQEIKYLEEELKQAKTLLYITDNCGEIVLDKIFIEELKKRYGNLEITVMVRGGLAINDDNKEVTVDGELIKLTPIEYNILLLLVKNAGKVFSIDEIYEQIWNEEAIGADNTVAVHIRHIREKIEINPREPRYLKVVWGVGYKIEKQ